MADLPSANVSVDEEAGALAGGDDFIAVIAPTWKNADATPRLFTSTKALLAQHDYAPGVDYCALHFEEVKKPVLFVAVPIATAGAIGQQDDSGVTGTCGISATAGAHGVLDEVEGTVTVVAGGTVGTDNIEIDLSLDGGHTTTRVRLGTATSYAIPYVGVTLAFTVGTLVAGDVFTFATKGPAWDGAGLSSARDALAAQTKPVRSFLVAGDADTLALAGAVRDEVSGYETENERFVYARVSVRDRLPKGKGHKARAHMAGAPTVTFAEVGATGDTITRTTGSFIADGFAVGDWIVVSGAVASAGANNVSGKIASLSATVITLDTTDLVAEGPISGVAIVASPMLTFAEVGATGDTVTRNRGSWLDDGFRVGDEVTFSGTASNNVTGTIAALTATVLTFGSTDLVAETIGMHLVSVVTNKTKAQWVSEIDAAFSTLDSEKRIDLSAGRGRKRSPIHGWKLRRPAAWAASLREYRHDLHVPTWRKADGALSGFDLVDTSGTNVVEYDERQDGGLLAARFTCFRTWANGPAGTFLALSLTRATGSSLLSRTHNLAVANLGCTVVHAMTEEGIGRDFELNPDGTATGADLAKFEQKITAALRKALLGNAKGEGPRASSVRWEAARDDDLNVASPTINGVMTLRIRSAVEKINTRVRFTEEG